MTGAGWATVALVATAVFLLVGDGAARLSVVGRAGRRGWRPPLPAWVAPRPDALSRPVRVGIAVLAGTATSIVVPGVGGLLAGLGAGAAALVGVGQLETGGGKARRARVVLDLPETLDLLAATLEAGAPMRGAVAQVGRLGPGATRGALESISAQVGIGVSDADAWRSLLDDPDWAPVARDLARSAETGSAAAQLLRQHAADARTRRHDELLKRARAVGVRSVLPLMCCFLPAFMLTGVVPIVAGLLTDLLHR